MVDPVTRASFAHHEPVSHDSATLIAPTSTPTLEPGSGVVSHATGPLLGGRYEILGLIGVGGMGSVYRARDSELEELVALKVLRKDLVSMPGSSTASAAR